MSRIVGFDWETFYDTKSDYGIQQLGTWRYLHDDRFDPYLLSVSDDAHAWAGNPRDFNWDALDGATLLSHNRHFDESVYEAGVEKGLFPRVKFANWFCTANMSACLSNRRALDSAVEFLLGRKVSKEVRKYADGKTADMMKAEGKWNAMLEYGRSDVINCRELWMKHGHRWTEFERRLSDLTIRQCQRGVQIDVPKLQRYREFVHDAVRRMEQAIPWVRDGLAGPKGRKALAEQCRKDGIPTPPIKSHQGGEEAYAAWYAAYAPRIPWIRALSDYFSVQILFETLEKIHTRTRPDGVMPFGLKYFGAHTGRWSGDAGINMQNPRKEPYYFDEERMYVTDDARLKEIAVCLEQQEKAKVPVELRKVPSWVSFTVDLRSLFIARPGKRMIISDLSQIEPRVLAWLVNDEKKLAFLRQGQSPYEAHARATMGWTGGELKVENKGLYSLAKARELGLGYQCGWEKFIAVALIMGGIDITKDDPKEVQETADFEGQVVPVYNQDGSPKMVSGYGYNSKRIVKEFREQNPLLASNDTNNPGIWRRLDTLFKASVGGDFVMELPSGRKLVYRNVRREVTTVYNEETKKYERKWVTKAEVVKNGVPARLPLYGGLLTENLTQATARDVFGEQLLTLDEQDGLDVLFSSHDESINEADEKVTKEEVDAIMSRTPEWLKGCPVAAETKYAPYYLK